MTADHTPEPDRPEPPLIDYSRPLCGLLYTFENGERVLCQREAGHTGLHWGQRLPWQWGQDSPDQQAPAQPYDPAPFNRVAPNGGDSGQLTPNPEVARLTQALETQKLLVEQWLSVATRLKQLAERLAAAAP